VKCGVPIAVILRGLVSVFFSLSTWYVAGCGARHQSEEETSQARGSDISVFVIEGEESLPGLPPGNPLSCVNFISKVGCMLG